MLIFNLNLLHWQLRSSLDNFLNRFLVPQKHSVWDGIWELSGAGWYTDWEFLLIKYSQHWQITYFQRRKSCRSSENYLFCRKYGLKSEFECFSIIIFLQGWISIWENSKAFSKKKSKQNYFFSLSIALWQWWQEV